MRNQTLQYIIPLLLVIAFASPALAEAQHLLYVPGDIAISGPARKHRSLGGFQKDRILETFRDLRFEAHDLSPVGADTPHSERAVLLATRIAGMLEKGTPPENITVVGLADGAATALGAAAMLKTPSLNFVLLAACPYGEELDPAAARRRLENIPAKPLGRLLFLYDNADWESGPCDGAVPFLTTEDYQEQRLFTGKGRALFFSPSPAWVDWVVRWANTARDKR